MSVTHTFIASILRKEFQNRKINIIDYGCGNGDLINYIGAQHISQYVGYEISDECLRVAKKNFTNHTFSFKKIYQNKLPKLGKAKSADLVILIGVIQYMKNTEIDLILKEVQRVLKKNGILLISCAVDHKIYTIANIYQLFLPNMYINRKSILKKIKQNKFTIELQLEKGLFIAPLFSNIISFFFDAADRILFHTKGKIGFFGSLARKLFHPLIQLEHLIPIDYGHTLFIVGRKTI